MRVISAYQTSLEKYPAKQGTAERYPTVMKETRMIEHYDLVVIGSGPGGQRAAIQAAKLGKRVAVVEKSDQLGGAGLRAGTIPTKALREAALALSGAAGSGLLTNKRLIRRNVTIHELRRSGPGRRHHATAPPGGRLRPQSD